MSAQNLDFPGCFQRGIRYLGIFKGGGGDGCRYCDVLVVLIHRNAHALPETTSPQGC